MSERERWTPQPGDLIIDRKSLWNALALCKKDTRRTGRSWRLLVYSCQGGVRVLHANEAFLIHDFQLLCRRDVR